MKSLTGYFRNLIAIYSAFSAQNNTDSALASCCYARQWMSLRPFIFSSFLAYFQEIAMFDFSPEQVAVKSAHFIGGIYIDAVGSYLEVARPSDGQIYAEVPVADAQLVDRAVENAWQAFKSSTWASQPPRDRARIMRRWADLIDADVATLAPMEAVGSTRPVKDA
eukprot:gene28461-31749_t